jgi:hypothetical protein
MSPDKSAGVRELKFVLTPEQLEPVAAWLRREMQPDPHAKPSADEHYLVHSLYFDSDDFATFHRQEGYDQVKYRARRYGAGTQIFVEEKSKRKGLVSKRRTAIQAQQLALLAPGAAESGWDADWFCRRLEASAQSVRCQIAYQRLARTGNSEGAAVRATLDRDLRCVLDSQLAFAELAGPGVRALEPLILELKYPVVLPSLFKRLIREFGLAARPISKYRLAILSCGLVVAPHAAEAG